MAPATSIAPELTVIVPVRNGRKDLETLLAALEEQTLKAERWELVVVDDCSTDGTPDAVRRHGLGRVVDAPTQGGSYAARNLGVAEARGTVLAFTDADCRPAPDWLESGLAALEETPGDVVAGHVEVDLGERPSAAGIVDGARHLNQEQAVRDGFGATANLWLRRTTLERIGAFNGHLRSGGDTEFGHRASCAGVRVRYASGVVVRHPARSTARALARKGYRLGYGAAQHLWHADGPLRHRRHICRRPGAYIPRFRWDARRRYEPRGGRLSWAAQARAQLVEYLFVQLPIVAGNIAGTVAERRRSGRLAATEAAPPRSRGDLREAAIKGVRWVTLTRVLVQIASLASMIALARLVSPAEFGRAAVALIAGSLAVIVAGGGFGTPLVQRKEVTREHLESAVLAAIASGLILTSVTWWIAPLVCEPVFGARTADLVQLMAPAFVINALGTVPQALLQRRLDFRMLSLADALPLIFGMVLSVALAATGLGAEAIILGSLATGVASSVMMLLATPFVRPGWHPAALREVTAFGIPAAMSALVGMAQRNVDYAILGARLSAAEVGFYWRAYQLGVEHQRKVSGIMMQVALPLYSRTRDLDEMRAIRGRIVRVHATLLFPLLAIFIATAPTLIPWLLGERWTPAVLPAQILAVAGMASAVVTGLGPLMLAAGRPRALLAYNAVSLVAFAVVVAVVAPYGLTTICIAVVAFSLVQMIAAHWLLLERLVGIPMRAVLADVIPAATCTAALLTVALPLSNALRAASAPSIGIMAVVATAGGLGYLAILRLLFRDAWDDAAMLVRKTLQRQRPNHGVKRTGTAPTPPAPSPAAPTP